MTKEEIMQKINIELSKLRVKSQRFSKRFYRKCTDRVNNEIDLSKIKQIQLKQLKILITYQDIIKDNEVFVKSIDNIMSSKNYSGYYNPDDIGNLKI